MSKFCSVCFDAGKDEIVFKSHFVKSIPGIHGVVVCPTLLAIECKYCHKTGHTVKYCNVLKENDKYKRRVSFVCDDIVKVEKKKTIHTNSFDTLFDSDSDDEVEVCGLAQPTPLQGWAAIVASSPPKASTVTVKTETTPVKRLGVVQKPIGESFTIGKGLSRSWADWSDSDDEEDEEEEASIDMCGVNSETW
jgi:hypothetical protein